MVQCRSMDQWIIVYVQLSHLTSLQYKLTVQQIKLFGHVSNKCHAVHSGEMKKDKSVERGCSSCCSVLWLNSAAFSYFVSRLIFRTHFNVLRQIPSPVVSSSMYSYSYRWHWTCTLGNSRHTKVINICHVLIQLLHTFVHIWQMTAQQLEIV